MPRNYKRKKTKRKRKYIAKPSMIIGGFPKTQMVRLRYCQEVTLDAVANGIAQHQFRCNSVYDPDYTGVGHQPMNFDIWSSVYDHYTVIRSRCKATPIIDTTTQVLPGYFGVMLTSDVGGTSTLANVTSIFENKLTSGKWVISGNVTRTGQYPSISGVNSYFNSKKMFGVKDPQDGAAYGAVVTNNPNKDAYFCVYQASMGGSNPGAMSVLVEIEYDVLFDEPITTIQN